MRKIIVGTKIFEHLRTEPESSVSKALSTPLMRDLARTAYRSPSTSPGQLLDGDRFTERQVIEDHLLERGVQRETGAYSHSRCQRASGSDWSCQDSYRRLILTLTPGSVRNTILEPFPTRIGLPFIGLADIVEYDRSRQCFHEVTLTIDDIPTLSFITGNEEIIMALKATSSNGIEIGNQSISISLRRLESELCEVAVYRERPALRNDHLGHAVRSSHTDLAGTATWEINMVHPPVGY